MKKISYLSLLFALTFGLLTVTRAQQAPNAFSYKKRKVEKLELKNPPNLSPSATQQIRSITRTGNNTRLNQAENFSLKKPFPFQSTHIKAASLNKLKEIKMDQGSPLPIFIEINDPSLSRSALSSEALIEAAAFRFFDEVRRIVPIRKPREAFFIHTIHEDNFGRIHVNMNQVHEGLDIWGKEVRLHFYPDGTQKMHGHLIQTPGTLNLNPAYSSDQAIQLAKNHVKGISSYQVMGRKKLEWLGLEEPSTELLIYPVNEEDIRLAYKVDIHPNLLHHYVYFLDAQSGEVLNYWDQSCTLLPPITGSGQDLNGTNRGLNIFQESPTSYILFDVSKSMFTGNANQPEVGQGVIITADMNNDNSPDPSIDFITSSNNTWSPLEVSAHWNASVSYDYFEQIHSWQSINGQKGDVISIINVPDEDGGGLDNAYWNGKAMFYGNGKDAFAPLAGSLDVGGHEMSHGVVQATSNLVYQDQPGALNESFADIFGVLIDRDDYLLGEEVVDTRFFPSGALRSMSDPHNGGNRLGDPGFQPKHMDEIFTGPEDNGGVHINSGIPNFAFFLFAESPGVGKNIAEQVYFSVLRDYLNRSSNFVDLRLAVVDAAGPFGNTVVNAAKSAFDQVGIFDPNDTGNGPGENQPPRVDPNQEIPANPGQDYILTVSESFFDFEKIFINTTDGSQRVGISEFEPARPISITDDGSIAVFVDVDDFLRFVSTDPNSTIREGRLSEDPIWANVAISKDGSRLAATLKEADAKIYVFDISGNETRLQVFDLFNPTTGTGGVSAGGVLYADALEWDYSGEFILYDALNEIQQNNGPDLEYWDVGVLKAWDNNINNFGQGGIFKIFSSLDESESIGNARFSKTSPFRIVFDYVNGSTNEVAQLTANIENGDIGLVYQNSVLGYPSYSKNDDFVVFDAENSGNPVIAITGLATDKLNNDGQGAFLLIEDAKWAQWYTVGQREIEVGIDDNQLQAAGYKVFPNPVIDQITIQKNKQSRSPENLVIYDLQGRKLFEQEMPLQQESIQVSMKGFSPGTYILQILHSEGSTHTRIQKN